VSISFTTNPISSELTKPELHNSGKAQRSCRYSLYLLIIHTCQVTKIGSQYQLMHFVIPDKSVRSISELNFRLWEPMGAFESCWTRIPEWSNRTLDWTNLSGIQMHKGESGYTDNNCGNTWENRVITRQRQPHFWEYLGVFIRCLVVSGSDSNML
jgi:hypothetical protein